MALTVRSGTMETARHVSQGKTCNANGESVRVPNKTCHGVVETADLVFNENTAEQRKESDNDVKEL